MSEERARSIAFKFMLSLTSLSVGFGLSQMTLASEVHVSTAVVTRLEKRVDQITDMQSEQIKQATELIGLLKVQNQILKNGP